MRCTKGFVLPIQGLDGLVKSLGVLSETAQTTSTVIIQGTAILKNQPVQDIGRTSNVATVHIDAGNAVLVAAKAAAITMAQSGLLLIGI